MTNDSPSSESREALLDRIMILVEPEIPDNEEGVDTAPARIRSAIAQGLADYAEPIGRARVEREGGRVVALVLDGATLATLADQVLEHLDRRAARR